MIHSHPVVDMDKHFIIDPITRAVTNAESKKTMLMQGDHNSERFSFEIPKEVEGHDLTQCNRVEIHYSNVDTTKKNKSLGVYEVDDLKVSDEDESVLVFTWLVSQNATVNAGSLNFLIRFLCVEDEETTYRWNTAINSSISIAKGMDNGEYVEEMYPDILTKWKADLFAAVYGMETTYVGPTEPESYPYIWFDTSAYYGTSEKNIGVLTIKDANGDKAVLYPETKIAATDIANEFESLKKYLNDYVTITLQNYLDERVKDLSDNLNESMMSFEEDVNKTVDSKQNGLYETSVELLDTNWLISSDDYLPIITIEVFDPATAKYVGVNCAPAPGFIKEWGNCEVYLQDIVDGVARFRASKIPSTSLTVNLVLWE